MFFQLCVHLLLLKHSSEIRVRVCVVLRTTLTAKTIVVFTVVFTYKGDILTVIVVYDNKPSIKSRT